MTTMISAIVSMMVAENSVATTSHSFIRLSVIKDGAPVVLHADQRDPILFRFVESLRKRAQPEIAIVSDFARSVIVVEKQRKPRTRPGFDVAQHRQIAVGIAERENRPPSNMQSDVLGLYIP